MRKLIERKPEANVSLVDSLEKAAVAVQSEQEQNLALLQSLHDLYGKIEEAHAATFERLSNLIHDRNVSLQLLYDSVAGEVNRIYGAQLEQLGASLDVYAELSGLADVAQKNGTTVEDEMKQAIRLYLSRPRGQLHIAVMDVGVRKQAESLSAAWGVPVEEVLNRTLRRAYELDLLSA